MKQQSLAKNLRRIKSKKIIHNLQANIFLNYRKIIYIYIYIYYQLFFLSFMLEDHLIYILSSIYVLNY